MPSRSRQLLLFMTRADETELSSLLERAIPDIRFVDGQPWPGAEPPVVDSIASCREASVYLWSPTVSPALPATPNAGRGFRGPNSGVVIQLERSSIDGVELLSGSLGAGWSAPSMGAFVDAVWDVVRRLTRGRIVALDGSPSPYRATDDAVRWVGAAPGLRFRANNSFVVFLPAELMR